MPDVTTKCESVTHTVYESVTACRVCGNGRLESVLDLGMMAMTGIFPADKSVPVAEAPLQLVFCSKCCLTQLAHRFDPSVMYGDDYGYRSGLNQSMVDHLTDKVRWLTRAARLGPGDCVLDIGSNDGTTLGAIETEAVTRIGIDPTGEKFRKYYKPGIKLIPDFFSAKRFRTIAGDRKAKLVTSIAMFYDLEDPIEFASQVREILAPDGLWHFEQSYLPLMLRYNSFDTICHEHVSYYSLHAIRFILEQAGMKIIDVRLNDINGGSFAVTAADRDSVVEPDQEIIDWMLENERCAGLLTAEPLHAFGRRVQVQANDLGALLSSLRDAGYRILGYGASTKGNVILQHCKIGPELMTAIAEINPDKFGCVTPGTHIPIVSDAEARAMKPDCFVVLPWHFRQSILPRERDFLSTGGRLIFPMPEIQIV